MKKNLFLGLILISLILFLWFSKSDYYVFNDQVDQYYNMWELDEAEKLLREIIEDNIKNQNIYSLKANLNRITNLYEDMEDYWEALYNIESLMLLEKDSYNLSKLETRRNNLITKKKIRDNLSKLAQNNDYFGVIEYYKLNKDFINEWSSILIFVYGSYLNNQDYKWAYEIAKLALQNNKRNSKINFRQTAMEKIEDILSNIAKDKTYKQSLSSNFNDTHIWQQFYIESLKIDKAQSTISNSKEVTIAIIDDWINPNHPDLTNNIRINNKEIKNNWKDDDKNWYTDDYVWFNAILWNGNMQPYWEHWTMVAWIIWAEINNKEWIAWITKKVKIMPIVACYSNEYAKLLWHDAWWCSLDAIKKWIKYAIDNWANIINLSLWWERFNYTNEYDSIIKDAYKKWIFIVVAAWNWDGMQLWSNWVNTNLVSVSPVCNDGFNKKAIFGVWALDKEWKITKWSNYWECADFSAFGEWIVSTSIPVYNWNYWVNYNKLDWTSFASPMIAWIIWLWFNKYWKLSIDKTYDALSKSLVENENWNKIIDVELFLTKLWWSSTKDYQTELYSAISRMYNNWLTSYKDVEDFMPDEYLTREQASKFFVKLANKFWKYDDTHINNGFSDIKSADPTLKLYIWNAYSMWIMKWKNNKFMPFNKLTQAQALAVILRITDWQQNEKWNQRYKEYYNIANNYWILEWLWFNYNLLDSTNITRKDVAVLIYWLVNKWVIK